MRLREEESLLLMLGKRIGLVDVVSKEALQNLPIPYLARGGHSLLFADTRCYLLRLGI